MATSSGDGILPEWLKGPLDELAIVATIILSVIGLFGVFLPPAFAAYYGAFTFLYILLFFYARKKGREKQVLKARLQSAEDRCKPNGEQERDQKITYSADALDEDPDMNRNSTVNLLVPKKKFVLADMREEIIKTRKGQHVHIRYDSDMEISLYVLDKWHRDHSNYSNAFLTENWVLKGQTRPLRITKDQTLYVVILNENQADEEAIVEIEIWVPGWSAFRK